MFVDFSGGKLPQFEAEYEENDDEDRAENRGNAGGEEYRIKYAVSENRSEKYQKPVLSWRPQVEL